MVPKVNSASVLSQVMINNRPVKNAADVQSDRQAKVAGGGESSDSGTAPLSSSGLFPTVEIVINVH